MGIYAISLITTVRSAIEYPSVRVAISSISSYVKDYYMTFMSVILDRIKERRATLSGRGM